MLMIENVLDQETRHEIRYHVQYVFLPKLVESVSEGYLPSIALFTFAPWYYNLRQYYDIKELKAAGVYEEFEKIDVDDDHMLILYTFPHPQEPREALYGAVMVNAMTNEAEYYTVEMSSNDQWLVGKNTIGGHSCIEFWDVVDKDRFVAWVVEWSGIEK